MNSSAVECSASRALTAVSALLAEAIALARQGDDYYVRAGAKFIEAREAAGGFTLEYRAALRKAEVAERTEQRCIQFAKDPSKAVAHREKERERDSKRRNVGPDAEPSSRNSDLAETEEEPAPRQHIELSRGELSEASRGFKAGVSKFRKLLSSDAPRRTGASNAAHG